MVNQGRVVVGTESALKIRGVKDAFARLGHITLGTSDIEVTGCKVESGVREQPFGFAEIQEGAENRSRNAAKVDEYASLYVGIENGIVEVNGQWFDPMCVAITRHNQNARAMIAFGSLFPIPAWMVDKVLKEGTEIGLIIQQLAGGGEKDVMKYLSRGRIRREELISVAVQSALIQMPCADRYERPSQA